MAYDLLLCNTCLKKRNSQLITGRSGYTACVISKGPVTDVMLISVKEVSLQPSAGKRHVDLYAVPNQALNHCPNLFKSVDMTRAQLTGGKNLLSIITGENGDAQGEGDNRI